VRLRPRPPRADEINDGVPVIQQPEPELPKYPPRVHLRGDRLMLGAASAPMSVRELQDEIDVADVMAILTRIGDQTDRGRLANKINHLGDDISVRHQDGRLQILRDVPYYEAEDDGWDSLGPVRPPEQPS
jgi:hypothetical protein